MSESDPTIDEVLAQPGLDLDAFTKEDAVDLGLVVVSTIRERDANLAVRIVLDGDIVFQAKLKNTGPQNDEWLAGKAVTVALTGEPSLLARLRGVTPEAPAGHDGPAPRLFGGSIPIRVNGEIVGTLTTSGEKDFVDHAVGVESIRRYLAARA